MAEGDVMIFECCGLKRNANFCPICGRELKHEPLVELLVHCRDILQGAEYSLSENDNIKNVNKYRKWSIWTKSLEVALAKLGKLP